MQHDDASVAAAPPPGIDPWALIDEIPSAVALLGSDGIVRWANRSAHDALGVAAGELVGRREGDVLATCRQRGLTVERRRIDGSELLVLAPTERADDSDVAFLVEASERLSGSLNLDRTMALVAEMAVPRLADACLVTFAEWRDVCRVAAVARGGVAEECADADEATWERAPADAVGTALLDSSAVFPAVGPEDLELIVPSGARWDPLRALGPATAMVVPLRARAVAVGSLTLLGGPDRPPFGPDDVALAEAFARRAGVALDNAALYRDRSLVARMLQRSLRPPPLPDVPHLDVGTRYRPVVRANDIGGDFYDMFPTADGRWAVVVGDVTGKGIAAAAMTGLARHTIRASARQVESPAGVLEALNSAIRYDGTPRLCTVAMATVVPSAAGTEVRLASGGHPPPLLLRASGEVAPVEVDGVLLGAFPTVSLDERVVELEPGDSLVFYTDGVTEARADHREFGEERLRRVVERSAGLGADAIAEHLLQEAIDFAHNGQTDDIAIVVLQAARPGRG